MIGTSKNPNNKGFDLFITTAPIPDLNDKLVVFGRVMKGEDIVQVLAWSSLSKCFNYDCLNY
jgi:cyclophilin family peptidyl-prolyl cis-trans isomerase